MPWVSWRGEVVAALRWMVLPTLVWAGVAWASPAAAQPAPATGRMATTYTRDVAPILYEHCTSCHRPGEVAPFNLVTYEDARVRARQIVEATERRLMPPWQPEPGFGEFEGARRLSLDQLGILRQWALDGAPEGDLADLPEVPAFTEGWQLGRPDLIVQMPETYMAPADGGDVFRNFIVPVPVGTRRYVRAMEFRPGSTRVIHHARVLVDATRELRQRDAQEEGPGFGGMEAPGARFPDGHFLGWAPGKMPSVDPLAWPIEPGSDFVIQMHLKPTGRPEPVRASIGLYFTDEAPVQSPVMLVMGSRTLDIPAGEANYVVTDSFTLPVAARALRIYPHAHYLARDMTVLVRMPNNSVQGLLHITDWDFNWQDEYAYAQPVDLPPGATIFMRYIFDNSAANVQNPSVPATRVRFGPETTDEMAELLVQLLPLRPEDGPALRAATAHSALMTAIAGEEKQIAEVPDDYRTHNALGVHYVQAGRVEEARQVLAQASRLAPDYAPAHYNLGLVSMSEGRFDEAASEFERAVGLQPDHPEALTNLGVLAVRAGDTNEAIRYFRLALQANPDHLAARSNLANLHLRRGDLGSAVAELQQVRRLQPGNLDVLETLASAYLALGDDDMAERALNEALDAAASAHDDEGARRVQQRIQLFRSSREGR